MSEFVEVEIEAITRQSEMAVQVVVSETGEEKWIPKSVIEDFDEDSRVLNVKKWFAEKEGLWSE